MSLWAQGWELMRSRLWLVGLIPAIGIFSIYPERLYPLGPFGRFLPALALGLTYLVIEWAFFESRLARRGALDLKRPVGWRLAGFLWRWLLIGGLLGLPIILAFLGLIRTVSLTVQPLIFVGFGLLAEAAYLVGYAWIGPILPDFLAGGRRRPGFYLQGRGFRRRARRLGPPLLAGVVSSLLPVIGGYLDVPAASADEWLLNAVSDLIAAYGLAMTVVVLADDCVDESPAPAERLVRVFE